MEILVRPYSHPDVKLLEDRVQHEYEDRYGGADVTPMDAGEFEPPSGSFLVGYIDGQPVAMGGWRRHLDGQAEMKRLYVHNDFRGRGLARRILAAVEDSAAEAGVSRLVLHTGDRQPEALALYASLGYEPSTPFGPYAESPLAVFLAVDLPR